MLRFTESVFGAVLFVSAVGTAQGQQQVTFSDHIAKIIYAKCSSCHRPGQAGPFDLLTYDDIAERADTIKAVIDDGYMPPWKNMTDDVSFQHDRRLTRDEFQLIQRWVAAGAPQGNPRTAPPLPKFPTEWQLGRPDVVVEMNGSFDVPASGPDVYRSFVFQLDLPEHKWVKAVEVKSQAKSALHHALFFVDAAKSSRSEDGKDGKPGMSGMGFLGRAAMASANARNKDASIRPSISLGGYVPGTTPMLLPGDNAMLLPKGSDIVMQVHFHPTGKHETEHAKLALYLADRPPSRQLTTIRIPPLFGRFSNIDIPAGKTDYALIDSFTLPVDVNAIRASGHAHYLGNEMYMTARLPSGKRLDLLQIHEWDLDWQDTYQFSSPVALPAGTVIHGKVLYDNSKANPSNPSNPPKRVAWGRESFDEMGSVSLQVVAKNASDQARLNEAVRGKMRRAFVTAARNGQLGGGNRESGPAQSIADDRLDANRDGRIQRSELAGQFPRGEQIFNRLDENKDGVLDKVELEAARGRMNRLRNFRGGRR